MAISTRSPVETATRAWLLRVWGEDFRAVFSPIGRNVARPEIPFATVRCLSRTLEGSSAGERVYRENEDDSDLLDVDLRTFSRATVSLQVYGENAEDLLLRLRASLSDPAELLASELSGLDVVEFGTEIDTSFEEGGEWFRRQSVDVVVSYASHYTTTTPAIATVEPTDVLQE